MCEFTTTRNGKTPLATHGTSWTTMDASTQIPDEHILSAEDIIIRVGLHIVLASRRRSLYRY